MSFSTVSVRGVVTCLTLSFGEHSGPIQGNERFLFFPMIYFYFHAVLHELQSRKLLPPPNGCDMNVYVRVEA